MFIYFVVMSSGIMINHSHTEAQHLWNLLTIISISILLEDLFTYSNEKSFPRRLRFPLSKLKCLVSRRYPSMCTCSPQVSLTQNCLFKVMFPVFLSSIEQRRCLSFRTTTIERTWKPWLWASVCRAVPLVTSCLYFKPQSLNTNQS